ncbi:MAG: TolC family protein [Gammaproteobacteria bacterium]|nr:TolC family protein [Gammaproteobacteria bacterium]
MQQVLRSSDTVRNLDESLLISQQGVLAAEHNFELRLVPLATLGASSGHDSQLIGMEGRKLFSGGQQLTVGAKGEQIQSDDYVITHSHSVNGYIRLSQGLFRRWDSNYTLYDLDRSQLQHQRQQLDNLRQIQSLLLTSARGYLDAVLTKLRWERGALSLKRSRLHYQEVESRFALGLVAKSDLYRARIALLNSENSLEKSRYQVSVAEQNLREQLAGGSVDVVVEIPQFTPVFPERWRQLLPDSRLEWSLLLLDNQLGGLAFAQAKRNLLPDISLDLSLEERGSSSSFTSAADALESSWSARLQLRSDLDNFAEQSALLRETINRGRRVREQEALRRKIAREVDDAWQGLQTAAKQRAIGSELLQQSHQSLELAQLRYQRGLSSNLELLDAEEQMHTAEMAVDSYEVEYVVAAFTLAHHLGILDMDWVALSLPAMTPP